MGSIDVATSETGQLQPWQIKVAEKTKSSREKIPKAWLLPEAVLAGLKYPFAENKNDLFALDVVNKSGILTEKELEITEKYTVSELLVHLASGSLTSVDVTTAFSKRAAIAQQLTSCLTETFFEEALERAKYLDQLKADGKQIGPLHGLPISIKDSFQVKGHEASIGFVSFLGRFAETNSPLVDILLQAGAVIYVKTNIPQTMMTADSDNNIFGRALNPHNTAINAGGSSGGEGALVAFRGSPLGVGTDVGGSVRIPAHCCGTFGFKPTTARIPYGGQATPGLPGFKPIVACAGPLANDFDAMSIFMKAVIDSTPANFDSTAIDVPWRQIQPSPQKIKFGVLPIDPLYPLHAPLKRSLDEAIKKLEAAGHIMVPLDPKLCEFAGVQEVAVELFSLGPKASFANIEASGEPKVPSVQAGLPPATFGNYQLVPDLTNLGPIEKLATLTVLRQQISESWRAMWVKAGIDAVIGPSAQSTAVPHDTFGFPPYTILWNLLDYPSCVIPYSKASKELDSEPFNLQAGQIGPKYDAALLDGAPCSVQITTGRMRDEECLQISGIVAKCLNL